MRFRFFTILLALFAFAPLAHASGLSLPGNNLGLVGYWSFNEGTSTVAHDFSGNGYNGTLSTSPAPTWVQGKLGKGLEFIPSSANRVTLGSASALNPASFTVTGWIKPKSTGSNTYDIIYATAPDCCTTGKNGIMFGYWGGGVQGTIWNNTSSGITGTALPNDQWTFAAFTYDGSTMKLYQNGAQSATPVTYGSGVGQPASYDAVIGALPNGNYSMNGSIDDVRLYNRALSDTEILALYRSGGSARVAQAQAPGTLASGLVGWWTMDGGDTIWTSSSAGYALDHTGGGNSATFSNMTQSGSPVLGRVGQALYFNGSNGAAAPSDVSSLGNYTISMWAKTTSNNSESPLIWADNFPTSPRNGFGIKTVASSCVGGKVTFDGYVGGTGGTVCTNTVVGVGGWHHYVLVRSGTVQSIYIDNVVDPTTQTVGSGTFTAQNIRFGAHYFSGSNQEFYNGAIDDVRLYNRALSAAEIAQLYSLGQPTHMNAASKTLQNGTTLASGLTGWWTMDGPDTSWSGAGSEINKANGSSANFSGAPAAAIGKIGQAIQTSAGYLDTSVAMSGYCGVSDCTMSAWVKPYASGRASSVSYGGDGIVGDLSGYMGLYQTNRNGTDKIWAYNWDGAETIAGISYTPNKWVHAVLVHTGGTLYAYENGALVAQVASGDTQNNAAGLMWGRGYTGSGGSNFNGAIDDVRVYNRALTPAEITQLYKMGK